MNQEKKYYTPEIEEFHAGFEYEENNPWSNTWNKEIFDSILHDDNRRYHFIDGTYERRVKYLDKEDIESLGWEYLTEKVGSGWIINTPKSTNLIQFIKDNDRYFLWYSPEYNKICICDQECPTTDVFKGIIKNKSELKKLMKQLGI